MFNYDFKNKDMVLDDSNSDINGHQMIWRKKTAKTKFRLCCG